jgi:hypothetical protein
MKVYLAGPMSGIPAFNIPAFDAAAETLRSRGFDVVSPAEVDGPVTREVLLKSPDGDHRDLPQDESWSYYLARDFRILHDEGIEAIVTLPGWENSKGADWEVYIGKKLGIPQIGFDAILELQDLGPLTHHAPALITSAGGDESLDPLYDEEGKFITHEDNPLRQRAVTGGVKDNRGKPRVDLLPTKPLMAVGRVLGFGARKYKPHNWRLGLGWSDTIGSALRHIFAFADGEDIDQESGECHIDNAITQLLFLSEYYHTDTGIDDRWSSLSEAAREDAKA